ncbi:MAG: serine/threonine protein kinase [Kiritimatiellae bacterium]|nr:serine/threonine protein kinase [Kiritimatiellia bacterium]
METQTLIRTDKLGRAKCEHCDVMLEISEFHVFDEIQCPECGKTTTVPGKLGDYYLMRELGRGGMGAVFLARDAHLERKVALKVLNAKFGQDPSFVDALLREAKAAAALNHKNIVHIYSFGQVYDQPYFVMEYVEGIHLDECINANEAQNEEGWLGIMGQVTQGLILAEEVGLIHGDIKPANILLNEQGVAKLSDFGIARFGGDQEDRILGTPLYIAPEKSRGRKFDARSDQFSLGAAFWHLLTGQPPYFGKTSREVVLHRFEIPPPDPRQHAPHLSQATAKMLMRMMAVEPEDRFPNFLAVQERIQKILNRYEEQRREKAKEEREAEKARLAAEEALKRKKRMKNRLGMAACAFGALVALGFVIFR